LAALARIARSDAADRWTRTAILSSVAESADRLLAELLGDPAVAADGARSILLEQLAQVVGARRRPGEVARVLEAARAAGPDLRDRLVLGLGRGLRQSGGPLAVGDAATPAA